MSSPPHAQPLPPPSLIPPECLPNVDHLVTEDDTPVDSILSEKAMRLLTEPLYNNWPRFGGTEPFLVAANVGMFYSDEAPPLVPDVLLSLDVKVPADLSLK